MPTTSDIILVDDSDARVSYNGTWTSLSGSQHDFDAGYNGPVYNATQHQTSDNAASFSFKYYGSNIRIRGGILQSSSNNPEWECLLDGNSITTYIPNSESSSFAMNAYTYCNGTVDDNGNEHEIEFTVKSSHSDIWFDRIEYVPPSVNSTSLDGETIFVSPQSTSGVVSYAGSGWNDWEVEEDDRLSDVITKYSYDAGAKATFAFEGTAFAVMTVFVAGSNNYANISLDDKPYSTIVMYGLGSVSYSLKNQILYGVSGLDSGNHTFDMVLLSNTSDSDLVPLTIAGLITTSSADTVTQTTQSVASSPTSSSSSDSSITPLGAIVGGIFGGVVLFTILGFSLCFWWRTRSARGNGGWYGKLMPLEEESLALTTSPSTISSSRPTSA